MKQQLTGDNQMDPNRVRSKPINNTIVVVPVFNEQERIEQVVASIKEMHNDLDILVVDDGSSDKTALFAKFAGARVIRLSSNMGYGVALQTGYKYAFNEGYDYLIQLDGDGQHDPKYIPNMLELLKSGQVDLVLGSRFLNEATGDQRSISNYRQSLARKLGIWMFSFLVSKLVKFKVTDPTSGYQAINRSVIAFFIQDFFPCDFPDADVIVMVHREN